MALPEAYRGKRVLLVGATGFLGGVALSLLLDRCPDLARVYVLLRRAPGLPAAERFKDRVLPSVAFEPLRGRWASLEPRVTVLQGDLAQPEIGLDEASLAELADLDLVLNCAGLVDFEAPLDQAHRTNILGVQHLIGLARRTGAHVVHVSTCFVAGAATGRRPETVEAGFFPRRDDAPYLEFDPTREVADLEDEIARITRGVEEQAAQARYREQALERFRNLNAGLPAPAALANAARRIQRDDLKAQLVAAGQRRATFWGWSNVYTYSKSIGEQLLARADGVRWTLVRPAIIESALAYPEPGYNLNATTSAPLVMLALNGFQLAPARPGLVFDIVPVDTVAAGVLAVGAAALGGKAKPVYQIGTSDVNPCRGERAIELIGLYIHEREMAKKPSLLEGIWRANREPAVVDRAEFEAKTRRIEALWKRLAVEARAMRERVDHPRLRQLLERAADKAAAVAEDLDKARAFWDLFLPFTHDYDYRFVSAHIRELWEELGETHDLRGLDWRTYWLDVHIPGLRRHVLTESFGKTIKPVSTPMSLAERVEAVARDDGYRAALTTPGGATLTYGDLWSRAGAIAAALGARKADEVAIEVDPDGWWIVALLGAQRAGCVARLFELGGVGKAKIMLVARAAGCEIVGGRKRDRVDFQRDSRPSAVGPSDCANPPAVAWGAGEPIAARELARRLERVSGWLACDPAAPVLASADAPPLALLAPLHAQAELCLVADADLPEAAGPSGATAAIVCGQVPAALHRIRAIADLAPLAGMARLEGRKARIAQVLADGLLLAAHRDVSGPEDRDEPFEAEPDVDWGASRWVVRVSDDRPDRVFLDGLRGGPARLGALQARLADQPGVAGASVHGSEGATLAFLRPDPQAFRDFRQAVTRLHRLLRDTNAAVPAAQRLHALIVSFGELPAAGDDAWEARTDWIRLSPRSERTDWAGMPEDSIPLDDLEEETVRLARGRLAPPDLDFVLAHHREGERSYERLLLLERVLVALFRRDGAFNAQAFLQRYGDEAARAQRLEYRVGFKLGTLVQKWRDWHGSEDPDGVLLPNAVTEPVKIGLGKATSAFFDLAMDVDIRGKAYVPAQGAFVVVANHSSHLDTGVVKFALGPWGERIRALAAKDYFFGTPARRFVAHHFTRLIPTERQAVTTEWVKRAREALSLGDCVLIFPEGTRSADPEVQPFKASLGTLLRACHAPVLPVYIHGTHEILPKGQMLPRGRKIRVHIGPPIPYAHLETVTADAAGTLARDRLMADYVRDAVAGLEKGDFFWLRDRALLRGGPEE